MPEHDGTGRDLFARHRWIAAAVAIAPLCALWIIIFFTHRIPWRVHYDQSLYHEPAIRAFMHQWPDIDLYDYLSATTPGYHLILAAFAGAFGDSANVMRIASGIIALLLVGLFGAAMSSRVKPIVAGFLAWPLACSMYVVQSGVYLLPDNLGWLGVCAMIVMALRTNPGILCISFMGLWLIFVVMARQLHAWTFGLVLVAAWLSDTDSRERYIGPALLRNFAGKFSKLVVAILAVSPAMLLLYGFVRMWDGPVPPRFATQYSGGFNAASTAFLLSLIAVIGIFQLPTFAPTLATMWRTSRRSVWISAISGFIAAAITPTMYDYPSGRRSGLWNIAAKLPNIGHSSVLILVLSTVGAIVFLALLKPLRARDRIVMCATFGGFCIATAAGVELWQRYTEPFVLMFITLLVGMNIEREREQEGSYPGGSRTILSLIGSVVIACGFAGMNIIAPFAGNSVRVGEPAPPPKSADDTSPVPAPVDVVPPPPPHGILPWMR
ncbi:MAG: hypothetical protein ACK54H_09945 [Phycisphaerales bacterium]